MVGIVKFEMRGVKEMEQMLKDLGPAIANRLGGRAVRAGARPIIKDAKARVPRRTGELKRSIVAQKERARGGAYAATQTVLIGFKKPASSRAHLVEFGAPARNISAQPFMRPALDSQHAAALKEMIEVLAKGILREEFRKAVADAREWEVFDENTAI